MNRLPKHAVEPQVGTGESSSTSVDKVRNRKKGRWQKFVTCCAPIESKTPAPSGQKYRRETRKTKVPRKSKKKKKKFDCLLL
jgi:hypothetical protein